MQTLIDDSICPLCKQVNRCDVTAISGCWCMKVKVPAELLAQVPAPIKNKSCICNKCIDRYHQKLTCQH